MPSVLCDVALWLEHAKELRGLSEVVSDPEEKEQMLVVAAGFDRIAELAQEQAALQEQCHRSAHRPARAWRTQKRQARNLDAIIMATSCRQTQAHQLRHSSISRGLQQKRHNPTRRRRPPQIGHECL